MDEQTVIKDLFKTYNYNFKISVHAYRNHSTYKLYNMYKIDIIGNQ